MKLSDLPSGQISRIDAICLRFEDAARRGEALSVDEVVARNSDLPSEVLRRELQLVIQEWQAGDAFGSPAAAGVVSSDASKATESFPVVPDEAEDCGEAAGSDPDQENPPADEIVTEPPSDPDGDEAAVVHPPDVRGGSDEAVPPQADRDGVAIHPDFRPPVEGDLIGPYRVGRMISRGGMGLVYRGHDLRLSRDVAIKVLAPTLALKPGLVERFDRESRAVAAIASPNIVELFDVGRVGQLPYAVMEWLRGETLDRWIASGPMDADLVRGIGHQIAMALRAAHDAGIIHRDLKPQNVMVMRPRPSGGDPVKDVAVPEVKVFDFGLSRIDDGDAETGQVAGRLSQHFDGDAMDVADPSRIAGTAASEPIDAPETHPSGDADTHTKLGTVMGTPGYMSPEQIRGDRATASADLFALGAILYECWTGRRAFDGENANDRIAATIASKPIIEPEQRATDEPLAKLLEACLNKPIENRPGSTRDLVAGLRPRVADSSPTVSRRQWGWAAAAVGGLGLLGYGAARAGWLPGLAARPFHGSGIRSLAVLPLTGVVPTSSDRETLGERPLAIGERSAALLIHELTKMPDLRVPAFRVLGADNPDGYVELARDLGVEALLDGNVSPIKRGSESFLQWELRLVDGSSGDILWNWNTTTKKADGLVAETTVAHEIAEVIGRQLKPTAAESSPPKDRAFACLINGEAHSDPDNGAGLREANVCFLKAYQIDPSYAEPIGGMAWASWLLAERSRTSDEMVPLLKIARMRSDEVLKIEPGNKKGLLVRAGLLWQLQGERGPAEAIYEQLLRDMPSDADVLHQLGRLQLAVGDQVAAIGSMTEASRLNPMSKWIRLDLARTRWAAGDADRAMTDIQSLDRKHGGHVWTSGLMIDLHEHAGRFAAAAALDPGIDPEAVASAAIYFPSRRQRLDTFPYGPIGGRLNEMIWTARRSESRLRETLSDFLDPLPPLASWLIMSHPLLAGIRDEPRVKEILPS